MPYGSLYEPVDYGSGGAGHKAGIGTLHKYMQTVIVGHAHSVQSHYISILTLQVIFLFLQVLLKILPTCYNKTSGAPW